MFRGRLGCLALARWAGRVGPPARWAATSNVGGSGTEEEAEVPYIGREGSTQINTDSCPAVYSYPGKIGRNLLPPPSSLRSLDRSAS